MDAQAALALSVTNVANVLRRSRYFLQSFRDDVLFSRVELVLNNCSMAHHRDYGES